MRGSLRFIYVRQFVSLFTLRCRFAYLPFYGSFLFLFSFFFCSLNSPQTSRKLIKPFVSFIKPFYRLDVCTVHMYIKYLLYNVYILSYIILYYMYVSLKLCIILHCWQTVSYICLDARARTARLALFRSKQWMHAECLFQFFTFFFMLLFYWLNCCSSGNAGTEEHSVFFSLNAETL